MEEVIVIGALLGFCVVLGLSMAGEMAQDEEIVALDPFGSSQFVENMDCSAQSLAPSRIVEAEPPFAPAQVLARKSVPAAPYHELSDDVLNRYRCYAQDLAQLREELAYSPLRAFDQPTNAAGARAANSDRGRQSVDVPIGAAFSRRKPSSGRLRLRLRQLPVAESVSTRV